jgi:hypothetical protein
MEEIINWFIDSGWGIIITLTIIVILTIIYDKRNKK